MDFISFSFLFFPFAFVNSFCCLSFHFVLYNSFSFCFVHYLFILLKVISFLYATSFHFVCSHLTLQFKYKMLLNAISFVCSHFISLVASRHFSKSMFRWKCLKIRIWWYSFKGQNEEEKLLFLQKKIIIWQNENNLELKQR